jgi:hypothetical protein
MSRPNPDFSLSPGNKSIAILFGRALHYRFITFKIFKIKKAGGYVMRSFFLNIYWATGHPPFLALANKCLLFIFSGRLWRFSVLTLTYCTVRRVAAAAAATASPSPSADIIAGTATDRPMASPCCCPVHLLLSTIDIPIIPASHLALLIRFDDVTFFLYSAKIIIIISIEFIL